ncbi:MAG: hypothetical protein GX130_05370 [Candidatus Hydrogenedens sp.]|nr:hypothetical protein [Candidatus Hydrogenedens sp.]
MAPDFTYSSERSSDRPPLVVIRSSDPCFLDVLRCCGKADIPVVPVVFYWEGSGPWISEYSCYYKDPVQIPNPARDEAGAVSALQELGQQLLDRYGCKMMIVPTSDTSQVFLQQYFEALKPFYFQMGNSDFNSSCMDRIYKDHFAHLMEEAGLPIPRSFACSDPSDIPAILQRIDYPCVFKPAIKDITNSFQTLHDKKKAVECGDESSLIAGLEGALQKGYRLVVQEKIVFDRLEDEMTCYVYADGNHRVRMFSGQHKIEEHPKPYGTGVASRFIYKEELQPLAQRLVTALKWRGFLGIEFMRDSRDGQWKIIEANMRPWLSILFQAHVGFNYIEYLYRDLYEDLHGLPDLLLPDVRQRTQPFYRLHMRVFLDMILNSASTAEDALNALGQWLESHKGDLCLTSFIAADPVPGIRELELLQADYPPWMKNAIQLLMAYLNCFQPDKFQKGSDDTRNDGRS